MGDRWRLQDDDTQLDARSAVSLIRARVEARLFETWFESESGRLLAVVTNGERAMVLLLSEVGDAGEHAVDPDASESMTGGYVLANGQADAYRDCDTVTLAVALDTVAAVVDGREQSAKDWHIDR